MRKEMQKVRAANWGRLNLSTSFLASRLQINSTVQSYVSLSWKYIEFVFGFFLAINKNCFHYTFSFACAIVVYPMRFIKGGQKSRMPLEFLEIAW